MWLDLISGDLIKVKERKQLLMFWLQIMMINRAFQIGDFLADHVGELRQHLREAWAS